MKPRPDIKPRRRRLPPCDRRSCRLVARYLLTKKSRRGEERELLCARHREEACEALSANGCDHSVAPLEEEPRT